MTTFEYRPSGTSRMTRRKLFGHVVVSGLALSSVGTVAACRIEAELRAARACCQVQAGNHWHHALAGTLNNEALLAQGTQTAIWITAACVRVVDACFAAGGGTALYESSPLQRRMRDLHVAAQHVGVQQRHYVNSGKLLLDSPTAKSNIVGDPLAESRAKR